MSQQVQVAAKKQVAVLENRLDQALKRFNSILADNKKKRGLIDHLRQEKVIFENLFKKLEKVLLFNLVLHLYFFFDCALLPLILFSVISKNPKRVCVIRLFRCNLYFKSSTA